MSCETPIHNMPPATGGAASRRRLTTSVADTPRSARGFNRTIMRALFKPLLPPEEPIRSCTAGSAIINFR